MNKEDVGTFIGFIIGMLTGALLMMFMYGKV